MFLNIQCLHSKTLILLYIIMEVLLKHTYKVNFTQGHVLWNPNQESPQGAELGVSL